MMPKCQKGQTCFSRGRIYLSPVQISRAPTYCVVYSEMFRKCPKNSFAKIIFSRTWKSMISSEHSGKGLKVKSK